MNFATGLIAGTLLRRYHRFLADVRLPDGGVVTAHCPNSGSMRGCSEPGRPVYLSKSPNLKRRYPFTWEIIDMAGTMVGVNTLTPNTIVMEALTQRFLPAFRDYSSIKRESPYGADSRIDMLLENGEDRCYLEVKNVTMKVDDYLLFPDAVTSRGAKHLVELMAVQRAGYRAVMFYVIQRADGRWFSCADEIDPEYCRLLRQAVLQGVEIYAHRAVVTTESITLGDSVPVAIEAPKK